MIVKCYREVNNPFTKTKEICNHEWNYKGKGFVALCPRCRQIVKMNEQSFGVISDDNK